LGESSSAVQQTKTAVTQTTDAKRAEAAGLNGPIISEKAPWQGNIQRKKTSEPTSQDR